MKESPVMDCPKCEGRGTVSNPRFVGPEMRKARLAANVGLRDMANALDLSAPYLLDLERGRRDWRTELVTRYKKALEKL